MLRRPSVTVCSLERRHDSVRTFESLRAVSDQRGNRNDQKQKRRVIEIPLELVHVTLRGQRNNGNSHQTDSASIRKVWFLTTSELKTFKAERRGSFSTLLKLSVVIAGQFDRNTLGLIVCRYFFFLVCYVAKIQIWRCLLDIDMIVPRFDHPITGHAMMRRSQLSNVELMCSMDVGGVKHSLITYDNRLLGVCVTLLWLTDEGSWVMNPFTSSGLVRLCVWLGWLKQNHLDPSWRCSAIQRTNSNIIRTDQWARTSSHHWWVSTALHAVISASRFHLGVMKKIYFELEFHMVTSQQIVQWNSSTAHWC